MPVPRYFDDGNFSVPMQNGPSEIIYPFIEVGDDDTSEEIVTFRQRAQSYRGPNVMSIRNGRRLVGDFGTKNIGNGLIEFRRMWTDIPKKRTEKGSIVYPLQITTTTVTEEATTYEISEVPLAMPCDIEYEYSTSNFSIRRAPRVTVVAGLLVRIGPSSSTVGPRVLAEDSVVTIYKGKIYQRVEKYVNTTYFRFA
jgi:hypothetical protein